MFSENVTYFTTLFFFIWWKKNQCIPKNAAGTTDNIATEEKLTAYFSCE